MVLLFFAVVCAVAGALSLPSSRAYRDGRTPRSSTAPVTLFWPYVLLPLSAVLLVLGVVDVLT